MATGNVLHAIGGEEALTEKRMGLFKELIPTLTRLGMISTAKNPVAIAELAAIMQRFDGYAAHASAHA
jgi:putative ABC transport system substrate-binding protein